MAKMRFLPTLDLWNPGVNVAVTSGRLVLQPGQWVKCGSDKPSRMVRVSDAGVIHAVHPQPGQQDLWLAVVRFNRASRQLDKARDRMRQVAVRVRASA